MRLLPDLNDTELDSLRMKCPIEVPLSCVDCGEL